MEHFCANCGSLNHPAKKNKGSIGVEALLLILSVLVAAANLAFGAILFLVFVVYCIWRLSSKYKICPTCESVNIIPATSPMARQMISQMYKDAHN